MFPESGKIMIHEFVDIPNGLPHQICYLQYLGNSQKDFNGFNA